MDKMKRIVALILAVLIVLSVASYLFYLLKIRADRPLAPVGGGGVFCRSGAGRAAGRDAQRRQRALPAEAARRAAWPAARSRRHPKNIIEDAKKYVCVRKSEISEDNLDVNEKNRGLTRFSIVA